MTIHRIGAAALTATLIAAPAGAQTSADRADDVARTTSTASADENRTNIRARLGLPGPTGVGWTGPDALAYAPAPVASTRTEARSRSVVFRGARAEENVAWPWGWTLRGFIGGLLAGPIGTGIAFNMAGNSDVTPPQVAAADGAAAPALDAALVERIRARRKEAAFAGGLVGTGVFLYTVLVVLDLDNSGETSIDGQPRPPDPGF